jgi:hypothetical protein
MNALFAGAIGGIVGGLTIAALGMAYGALTGRGLWALPNAIGGILLGARREDARSFGIATLVGATLHVVLSAAFGIVIALIAQRFTHAYAATGAVAGVVLWAVNYLGIGSIHRGSREVAQLNPVPVAVGLHVVFGLIAGAVAVSVQ